MRPGCLKDLGQDFASVFHEIVSHIREGLYFILYAYFDQ